MLSPEQAETIHRIVRSGDYGKIASMLTVTFAQHLQGEAGLLNNSSGTSKDQLLEYAAALEANPKIAVSMVLYFTNSEARDSLKRAGISLT